jgi:hypothetical protein
VTVGVGAAGEAEGELDCEVEKDGEADGQGLAEEVLVGCEEAEGLGVRDTLRESAALGEAAVEGMEEGEGARPVLVPSPVAVALRFKEGEGVGVTTPGLSDTAAVVVRVAAACGEGVGARVAAGVALEVVKDMIYTSGLGMYIKFLQSAARLADNSGGKLTWDHFVQAHDIIVKLSQKREG